MGNLMRDLGRELPLRLLGDATAASGMARRRGAGRVRHIEVGTLWLQQIITEKKMVLGRRPGKENEADLGTKHLAQRELWECLGRLGFVAMGGRSEKSLRASIAHVGLKLEAGASGATATAATAAAGARRLCG